MLNPAPDTQIALDKAVGGVQAHKGSWVALSLRERITILDEIGRDIKTIADGWVAAGLSAKGLRPNSFGEGEEWLALATIYRQVRLLRQALIEIERDGKPRIPGPITTRPDGQVVVRVFPQDLIDRIMLPGVQADVWLEPGVEPAEVAPGQAAFYRDQPAAGKVVLVLGAGNNAALVPGDFLYKLFVEGKVVVLKPNPVNAYLGPLIEQGFRALVQRGFLQIVYGGAEVGRYLCRHPAVDEIHMTGSRHTYEAIVFGSDQDEGLHRAKRRPRLDKPVTAELGNISPVIVVPGPWSDHDIEIQARKLASWLVFNSAFACVTPRVVIQAKAWAKRERLTQAIGRVLSQVDTRQAYYPGAAATYHRFVTAHPEARPYGAANSGHLPWAIIPDVDPNNAADICFRQEPFCSLLAETALAADNPADYIDRAVAFANDSLWGTLIAAIVIHPKSLKDPAVAAALDRAVANLRYGSVVVNLAPGFAYFFMVTPWGGFPGHTPDDIQSGIGVVNNVLMLARPQKSVIRGPFKPWPDPFVVTFRHGAEFFKDFANFQACPSLWQVPGLFWKAAQP
ncbi:MAG TPA: aldehyde dehydrogenase family protein [Anaerolineae bacterium]|nr:aldehyde dehydrogenase family protein [Anaerolineae bacterium]